MKATRKKGERMEEVENLTPSVPPIKPTPTVKSSALYSMEHIDWHRALKDLDVSPHQTSRIYRALNVLFACALVVLTLPILLFGMLLVRLSSRGSIFYKQTRMGYMGGLFTIVKLRTMVRNAEKSGAVWAKKGDCRITPVGKFLRKTRIDELPQLINVIQGDMNIIGPRPERPEFFDYLCETIPGYYQRLVVKPGVTGWAQINSGYAASVDDTKEKQDLDLHYVQNQSYWFDFKILLHTLRVVLTGHGAQ